MTTTPGADERRIRYALRKRGLGYTPQPPAAPASGDEWWDRLYDDTDDHHGAATPRRRRIPPLRRPAAPKAVPEPTEQPEADPEWEDAEPVDESTPAVVRRDRRNPARELHTTWGQVDRRTRWLLTNGAAATAGWYLGLAPLFHGWVADCGRQSGTTAALCLGGGLILGTALLDGRTRGWWPPLAWACRIPLASAVLAIALYAPGVPQ